MTLINGGVYYFTNYTDNGNLLMAIFYNKLITARTDTYTNWTATKDPVSGLWVFNVFNTTDDFWNRLVIALHPPLLGSQDGNILYLDRYYIIQDKNGRMQFTIYGTDISVQIPATNSVANQLILSNSTTNSQWWTPNLVCNISSLCY